MKISSNRVTPEKSLNRRPFEPVEIWVIIIIKNFESILQSSYSFSSYSYDSYYCTTKRYDGWD